MFLQQPGLIVKAPFPYRGDGTIDEVVEQGTWINADPLRGCILCNIGESEWSMFCCGREEGLPINFFVVRHSVGDLVEWIV